MTQAEKTGDVSPHEENRGLLAGDDDDDDLVVHRGDERLGNGHVKNDFAGEEPLPTPRSAQRVRFDLTPAVMGQDRDHGPLSSAGRRSSDSHHRFSIEDPERFSTDSHHRMPLLTDMEAPSVTVANQWGDGDETDELERSMRRPKSGMSSAFMNMANSIIGAGIIGQPYAMRQAGLLSGTLLLVGLTILIDWTIRLIVINSKLSGTSSFQGTVEYCFGKAGLIAISLAQWVFAFGGMVAFGVIVGDTIPHVLKAVWPDLPDLPVIGLLADRRVAIAVFCMGVSYPLTLYRDIAKVGKGKRTDGRASELLCAARGKC